MNPEFAEAMLRVLNDNAEAMARHIATGQSVILKPLPNPLDFQNGEPMSSPERDGPDLPPAKLDSLIVREHTLEIDVTITLLAHDDYLSDASKRLIEEELNQHLTQALRSRGMGILNIDEWKVEFA